MKILLTRLVPLAYLLKQQRLIMEELEKYILVQRHPVARVDIDEICQLKMESEKMERLVVEVLGHISAEGHYLE